MMDFLHVCKMQGFVKTAPRVCAVAKENPQNVEQKLIACAKKLACARLTVNLVSARVACRDGGISLILCETVSMFNSSPSLSPIPVCDHLLMRCIIFLS